MSFFKRKEKNLIPALPSEQSARQDQFTPRTTVPSPPSYRTVPSTYAPSINSDYNSPVTPSGSYAPGDRYASSNVVGDVYSRGQANLDKDRSELFAGFNAEKAGSGRFNDGPSSRSAPPVGEETDEDVEGIKQQLRFTKQESVNSTRNALRIAREAEETARNTLGRLGDQSEKLANTERHLDVSKGHALRAEDRTDELKQLNRSIFRPVITFNKDAKRAAQDAKLQQRYDEDREEREKAMMDIRETQNRIGRAYGDEGSGSGRFKTAEQLNARKEQRKRYQFEATGSDDELEDELDDNLNEISDMTRRLKTLGTTMGQELDSQIIRIGTITEKTDGLDNKIFKTTQRLNRIK